MSESGNPLLDHEGLPPFSAIRPEHVLPAVKQRIAEGRRLIEQVVNESDESWDSVVAVLDEQDELLSRAFGPVSHLNAVAQTEALREAYNACLPLLSEYATETGQNTRLYAAYRRLSESQAADGLTPAQQKDLENTLRDFHLSGVDLPPERKQQFMENARRLAELTAKFADNVLDATESWTRHVTDAQELEGLPEAALAVAAERAKERKLDGWLLTLDFSSYYPVMCHVRNRALREEMYRAYVTRASDQGPDAGRFDNGALMNEILALRHAQAQLLRFSSYAEKALVTRMARSVDEVIGFLRDLARRSRPQAERELAELRAFAREQGVARLEPWDIPFWSERLRERRYAISEEELRPWFPVDRVLDGMFGIVGTLFGIRITPRDGVDVWHPDVRFFDVRDADDDIIAGFYLDLYARTGKRGGAWMDECLTRMRLRDGSLQQPVAYLTCNFAPPSGGRPGLLTHDDVVTLFHEFGHGLHHMLTEQEVSGVSGISGVAWDAVELPSQFLENWCWTDEGVARISGHFETGEPLPREKLERLLAARNFQSALGMLRQIEFALFDMRIHAEYHPDLDIQQVLDEVRAEVAVIRPPSFNRFQHSFSHIFAGGYAAGYYSYKWAEVLSADAFSRFEEEGVFNPETGRAFREHILAQGGSREPMELFVAFRGREPSIEPLLRHSGIGVAA